MEKGSRRGRSLGLGGDAALVHSLRGQYCLALDESLGMHINKKRRKIDYRVGTVSVLVGSVMSQGRRPSHAAHKIGRVEC